MIFGLFRRDPNRQVIERLHGEIMAAARQPALFLDFGVADTVEGRFEALTLIAAIALRRMSRLPPPAGQLAQQLTDAIFAHFDVAMREMGVADVGVAKRMKTLAQGFLGRSAAYGTALDQGGCELEAAILRNVYGGQGSAASLAAYAVSCAAALETADLTTYLKGPLPFPPAPSTEAR